MPSPASANQNPEQIARDKIDAQLRASGWATQNKDAYDPSEGAGQAVLKKAFSGQLVEQDPSDEPASVLLERIRKGRDAGAKPERRISSNRNKH